MTRAECSVNVRHVTRQRQHVILPAARGDEYFSTVCVHALLVSWTAKKGGHFVELLTTTIETARGVRAGAEREEAPGSGEG